MQNEMQTKQIDDHYQHHQQQQRIKTKLSSGCRDHERMKTG
jgi:hypothetical protein